MVDETKRVEDFLLPEHPEREEVVLPSGLPAVLRPPTFDFCIKYGDLPGSIAAAAKGEDHVAQVLSREALVRWAHAMIEEVFIEPKFSQNPGPGEFHPSRLKPEDRMWIERWANRWIFGGAGADLRKFRGKTSGEATADGTGGGDVQQSTERLPGKTDVGVGA